MDELYSVLGTFGDGIQSLQNTSAGQAAALEMFAQRERDALRAVISSQATLGKQLLENNRMLLEALASVAHSLDENVQARAYELLNIKI